MNQMENSIISSNGEKLLSFLDDKMNDGELTNNNLVQFIESFISSSFFIYKQGSRKLNRVGKKNTKFNKMKKVLLVLGLAFSLTSCWDFNREQDYKDAENKGKSVLIQAESEKKAMIEESKANYESAKLNAKTKIEKAQADAEAKLISAKAEASARLMNAESQAKANKMLDESITPTILEFNKINRWNGKLPTTTLGQNQNSIINLK